MQVQARPIFLIACKKTIYFIENLKSVNTFVGPGEDRVLLSGLHTISDLYCKNCNHILGWLYKFLLFFIFF